MRIKTILRVHLTPVRIATIRKKNDNKYWWGCGEKGTLIHCWWECKLAQPLWKPVWRLHIKTKNRPTIRFLYTTLRNMPEGMWVKSLQRHLHTHVYCSTILNS
jgi:hypothetical protein